jgi:hypothetical protein
MMICNRHGALRIPPRRCAGYQQGEAANRQLIGNIPQQHTVVEECAQAEMHSLADAVRSSLRENEAPNSKAFLRR